MSNTLAISVSLKHASIALEKDGKVYVDELKNDTSTFFVSFVNSFLTKFGFSISSINKLIIASGPGSFTGLRVGMSFAKAVRELFNTDIIVASYFDVIRALYSNIKYDLIIINSENHNEFYYQKANEYPNTALVSEELPGKYNIIISEPNAYLDKSIKCDKTIICSNLKLASNLLLLKDSQLSTELSPMYIKPPYALNFIEKNKHSV